MCAPNLVVAGIGLAASAAQANQQRTNQRRTVRYQNQVTQLTYENATRAAVEDSLAMRERMRQVQASAAMEITGITRQAEEARAQSTVQAQSAGLGESTLADLNRTLGNQINERVASTFEQMSWEQDQIQRQMDKVQTNYQNRMNSRNLPSVPGIDYASIAAGVGQAFGGLVNTTTSWDKII